MHVINQQVHDREGTCSAQAEVSRTVGRKRAGATGIGKPGGPFGMGKQLGAAGKRADGGGETVLQTDKKILHLAWHPERDVLAIAGLNRLYFYTV